MARIFYAVAAVSGVMVAGGRAWAVDAPLLSLDDIGGNDVRQVLTLAGTPRNTSDAARLTLYWDNDGGWAKPIARNDKHYTAGVGASASFQAPFVDALLSKMPTIGGEFAPEQTDYAMGVVGSLNIFTPGDYQLSRPIFNDRPYAGWTYGGVYFQRANRLRNVPVYESLEVDAGLVGPSSLAENAQIMIHDAFHYTIPRGWSHQLNDSTEFDIKYNRRWRFDLMKQEHLAPALQVMPEVGVTAGSLMDEVHGGAVVRLGWNLPDDFGPGRMAEPAEFTGRVACGCEDWFEGFFSKQRFYFFARPYGELVARNALLQGGTWADRDPVTVNPEPAIFAVEYGISHQFLKHFEFTYSWTSESPEFHGQHNWDTWASVQLSFFVAW